MVNKNFNIATFNLENLDDKVDSWPKRRDVLRPLLVRINADLLFLQEVNSLSALDDLVKDTIYEEFNREYNTKEDGSPYKVRNLVTLSRYPMEGKKQYHHDLVSKPVWRIATAKPSEEEPQEVGWERPILHCVINLAENRKLHAINLHLKSKNPTEIKGQMIDRYTWASHEGWAEGYFLSSVKRVGQALETRRLIEQLFEYDPQALISICGDFNAEIGAVPFKIIVGSVEDTKNPDLRPTVMVPCEYNVSPEQRYSLMHHGRGSMLDHVIVSQAFYPYWVETVIFNELLHDETMAYATEEKFPESDHAPVVSRFQVPEDWF